MTKLTIIKNKEDSQLKVKRELAAICVDYTIMKPSEIILNRMTDFIINNYPNIETQEIQKAFDMNARSFHWEKISSFGSLDKNFIGGVMVKYLEWKMKNKSHSFKPIDRKIWTKEDSYNEIFKFKSTHGRFPSSIGAYHWAYEHAVDIGEINHNPKDFNIMIKRAKKEIGKLEDAGMLLISKSKEDDIMRLTKKMLFIKHYKK